jgi:hypothetical protein
MSDRCEECGSWDRECGSATAVEGCGCARCLSVTVVKLHGKLCALTEERDAARANHLKVMKERDEAILALSFFASVIKSGEPWTEACEKVLRSAQQVAP